MDDKNKSKISILIVPHAQKVKRLAIPSWLPKVSILLFSIFILLTIVFIDVNFKYQKNLKLEDTEKAAFINILEEKNKLKDSELTHLKLLNEQLYEKTIEVEEKLTEINTLQKRLEKIADIKSPSRGGPAINYINIQDVDHKEEMTIMGEVLEDKRLELEAFIDDLEVQFEYLETVPDFMPTTGKLTSKFGNRVDPYNRRIQFHQGIDIANSSGTNIVSAGKGTVTFSDYKSGYGRTIIIDHNNGYTSLYAHCSKLLVVAGDKVEKNQLIAKTGSSGRATGNHLHFEIHKDKNPVNPYNILK